MDKIYDHTKVEEKIYKQWEEGGYFQPEINPTGKPYSIILPPPNANGDLHFGHAMFVVEDILIRYHRMLGDAALWLPGTDHAGTETQFVFEKKLQAEGKSRFDYNRQELFDMIWKYVGENQGGIEKQLRRLGFSLDWSRQKFTLDPDIVAIVKDTFRKMYNDGLIYRDYRLVNYCTRDGTSFSDLEVVHEERVNPLYYIKYGPLTLATTRPETKFGDTAVAVHPDDKRYTEYVGKEIEIETVLGKAKIQVIADESVDPTFGTGVVKITPAHDFADFETGRRHHLAMKQVIGFDGKMNHYAGEFEGLYVKQARAAVVEKMKQLGLLVKVDEQYVSRIGVCYKCKTILEPLPLEQWYVKVKPLIENANKAVDEKLVKIYPQGFVHTLKLWYAGLRDWNISRQNVWGIQIPVWYEIAQEKDFSVSFIDSEKKHMSGQLDEILKTHSWEEIENGLQKVVAPITAKIVFEDQKEKNKKYLPETDTFDTWFSSGQWPYVTLKTSKPGDFEKFYPTSVMETGYDILKAWVSRMLMLGLYVANGKHVTDTKQLEKTVPFRDVVLHGLVNDPLGKKMSKSKGNVVNPLEVADQYGADTVRFALVYGTGLGNDQAMSYAKLDAARKFTNKLWNMARFLEMKKPEGMGSIQSLSLHQLEGFAISQPDKDMVEEVKRFAKEITEYLEKYQFNLAAERLYEFSWHTFADKYIEDVKSRVDTNSYTVLANIYTILLELLHPFMPFVTEEIYSQMGIGDKPLIVTSWPK
ncbi:MAG TPA: valine--tRNA ligase [Candidatus Eisenbacteria bacterium]|nr:valine--tRNA ligase [Candidatus Eisenbacteria bacterium]